MPGVIGIEDFGKVALRVAEVVAAEPVPKADKLLKLQLSLGEGQPQRQVVSGIAKFYQPDELVGKDAYRRQLVSQASGSRVTAYIYASAGDGESTQDLVFGGHDIIAENGQILAESKLFSTGVITADLDIERLVFERRRRNTFTIKNNTNCLEYNFPIT